MNWFERIWNNIVSSNDQQYLDKISDLENRVLELEEESVDLIEEAISLKQEMNFCKANYTKLRDKYENLKESLEEPEPQEYTTPEFLDTTKFPYIPSWLIFYYDNGIKTQKVTATPSKFYRMWTDDMYHYFKDGTKNLKKFDSIVVKLRDMIKDITTYETDVIRTGKAGENWRPPTETFYGKLGDCEDTTILWVTACNICGISPERVFNATGYLNQFNKDIGHSYGLAKFDDGEWYVIETTSKTKPVKFKGSKYRIPKQNLLNGLTNWEFSGESKKEQF